MPLLEINGHEVNVDIREELEAFDWRQARWESHRLIASSPFRYEQHASFYVYLEDTDTAKAGFWGDSGALNTEYEKGGFLKLLAFLRGEDVSETANYLLDKYGGIKAKPRSSLKLRPHPSFKIPRKEIGMDWTIAEELAKLRHPYLERRGISRNVLLNCKCGYDAQRKAVSIPWIDERGRLLTIKFRTIYGKAFWYHEDGEDIRAYLWGMNFIYEYKLDWAVLVEAEIDAMYLISCGIPAIAAGNKYFNEKRADIIKKSPIKRIIIGADNDAAGDIMKNQVIRHLASWVNLQEWTLPDGKKDINEVDDVEQVKEIVAASKDIKMQHIRLSADV